MDLTCGRSFNRVRRRDWPERFCTGPCFYSNDPAFHAPGEGLSFKGLVQRRCQRYILEMKGYFRTRLYQCRLIKKSKMGLIFNGAEHRLQWDVLGMYRHGL